MNSDELRQNEARMIARDKAEIVRLEAKVSDQANKILEMEIQAVEYRRQIANHVRENEIAAELIRTHESNQKELLKQLELLNALQSS